MINNNSYHIYSMQLNVILQYIQGRVIPPLYIYNFKIINLNLLFMKLKSQIKNKNITIYPEGSGGLSKESRPNILCRHNNFHMTAQPICVKCGVGMPATKDIKQVG